MSHARSEQQQGTGAGRADAAVGGPTGGTTGAGLHGPTGDPGRRTLVEGLGSGAWPTVRANLGVPVAAPPPAGPARVGAPGPADAPRPGGSDAHAAKPPGAANAQAAKLAGPGGAPAVVPDSGICLDPEASLADLQRIAGEADQLRGAVDPDGAGGGALTAADGSVHTAHLRKLTHELEVLRPVVEGCGTRERGALVAAQQRAQDAVLRAYQTLAVHYADQTLQRWSTADADARTAQRNEFRHEAGGLGATDNWCGTFVNAEYRAAGMSGALNLTFNSYFHARQFFTYGTGSANSPQRIIPHGTEPELGVREYHDRRGVPRSWLAHDAIGDDIRPGDVVTLDWRGMTDPDDAAASVEDHADHVCIVRSYTPGSGAQPGVLITIDGNAFGARKPGAASPAFDGSDAMTANVFDPGVDASKTDISTNRYEAGDAGTPADPGNGGPAFQRTKELPPGTVAYRAMTLMGRGRPSLVDFEADHVYPGYTGRTDAAAPSGPIQRPEAK